MPGSPGFEIFRLKLTNPNGNLFHLYLPKGVEKVVSSLDSSSSTQCQYPAVRSTVKNTLEHDSSGSKSSRIGSWYVSLLRALFRWRESMHTLWWPDLLVVTTTLLTQLVGSSTLDRTRRFSNQFNSPLNLSLSAVCVLRGGVTTGCAVSSTCRCTWPGRVPSSFLVLLDQVIFHGDVVYIVGWDCSEVVVIYSY